MTDDQDAASAERMEAVQRLIGDEGVEFTHHYATFPLCCPARATLITGQYAHNHGVLSNDAPDGGYSALSDPEDTLPVWLSEAGYRTAWIGKYLNEYGLDGSYEVPPGWTDWRVFVENTYLRMYDYTLTVDGELIEYGAEESDYQTDVLAEHAVEVIEDAGEDPLFMVVSPLAPHGESEKIDTGGLEVRPAPRHLGLLDGIEIDHSPSFNEADVSDKPEFARRQEPIAGEELTELEARLRAREASLLAVDEMVERIVAALEDTGELDETVLIFTSDNGFMAGEHRLTGKEFLYEESARVPLLIRGPGFRSGEQIEAPVANVDLVSTFLELAGAEATRELDGVSLLTEPAPDRAVLLENSGSAGLRSGEIAFYEHRRGEIELYDLAEDPFQLESLHEDPEWASAIVELSAALARLRDCAGSDCVAPPTSNVPE